MTGSCGRCRVMPAEPGEAWCTDCLGEESPGSFVAGVHVSRLDPAEVRGWGCTCPIGGLHVSGCPVLAV